MRRLIRHIITFFLHFAPVFRHMPYADAKIITPACLSPMRRDDISATLDIAATLLFSPLWERHDIRAMFR